MICRPPSSSGPARRDLLAAQLRGELLLDGPDEVGSQPARRLLRGEDDLLVLGGLVVRRGVLVAGQRRPVAFGHQVEDLVAALDDLGLGRDDEGRDAGARPVLGPRHVALLDRIQHEVVVRRRLREARQDRGFCERQVVELLAEVRPRGRLDPIALVAVVVLVHVGGDDVPLALDVRECLGQADRLDDLLQLPLDLAVRILDEVGVEEPLADELLGDRGGAAAPAAEAVDPGRDDRERVEAGVLPECPVFDRRLGVDDDRRDVLERDDLAPGLAEPGQFDARPVADDRFLLEPDLVDGAGRLEVLRQAGERGDRRDGDEERDCGKREPDDQRDHPGRAGLGAFELGLVARVGHAAGGGRGVVQRDSLLGASGEGCHPAPVGVRGRSAAVLRRRVNEGDDGSTKLTTGRPSVCLRPPGRLDQRGAAASGLPNRGR